MNQRAASSKSGKSESNLSTMSEKDTDATQCLASPSNPLPDSDNESDPLQTRSNDAISRAEPDSVSAPYASLIDALRFWLDKYISSFGDDTSFKSNIDRFLGQCESLLAIHETSCVLEVEMGVAAVFALPSSSFAPGRPHSAAVGLALWKSLELNRSALIRVRECSRTFRNHVRDLVEDRNSQRTNGPDPVIEEVDAEYYLPILSIYQEVRRAMDLCQDGFPDNMMAPKNIAARVMEVRKLVAHRIKLADDNDGRLIETMLGHIDISDPGHMIGVKPIAEATAGMRQKIAIVKEPTEEENFRGTSELDKVEELDPLIRNHFD